MGFDSSAPTLVHPDNSCKPAPSDVSIVGGAGESEITGCVHRRTVKPAPTDLLTRVQDINLSGLEL
jgi:hypothetical protein